MTILPTLELCRWFGARRHTERQRKPRTCGVLRTGWESSSSLDAPILSPGTGHARRGSRKRPDPPRHMSLRGGVLIFRNRECRYLSIYDSQAAFAAWFGAI